MTIDLNLFQEILFLSLRPWMRKDVSDARYKEMIHEINRSEYLFQPSFDVKFLKPLTPKRIYYHTLIENATRDFLNNFQQIIESADTTNVKKYWVHKALTKVISQKLRDSSQTINDNEFYLETISPDSISKSTNKAKLDDTYIIQLLKFQLIRLYLEIQMGFKTYLNEDALSENELHSIFFTEQSPSKSFIAEAKKIKLATPASQVAEKPDTIQFTPKAFDFRNDKKGVLTYKIIVKDANRFSRFEEELFTHELIDVNYNFKKEHGKIQEMAAIFQTLFKKGYFNKRNFEKKNEIKPIDIRKFLDHRYVSDTSKQFQTWGNDPTALANFIEERYWIDKLPAC